MKDQLTERVKTAEDRQALLDDDLLGILIDPNTPDEDIGAMIRAGERIGRVSEGTLEGLESACALGPVLKIVVVGVL
ncbi:hypothetical protein [Nocardia noduli]|uniref:hypothetical protein n=1 Tax=Nocardia noduli TaxID=2815722 RepID=UPI001C21F3E7|nr:hypothetical protein [Nocardia noduli]